MTNSPNSRLKTFIDSLSMSYEKLAEQTGVARRTWQRQVEEGASIKSDYLLLLRDKFGADISWILTGESVSSMRHVESVAPGQHNEDEGVSPVTHIESVNPGSHKVNEKIERYKSFKETAPKGSMAAKLKLEDYENPMVILSYATSDMLAEWEGRLRSDYTEEENDAWLKEALSILQRIVTKHLKTLDEKQERGSDKNDQ